jgi:hypothetical protein
MIWLLKLAAFQVAEPSALLRGTSSPPAPITKWLSDLTASSPSVDLFSVVSFCGTLRLIERGYHAYAIALSRLTPPAKSDPTKHAMDKAAIALRLTNEAALGKDSKSGAAAPTGAAQPEVKGDQVTELVFMKVFAMYLIKEGKTWPDLWAYALSHINPLRDDIVKQVISNRLPLIPLTHSITRVDADISDINVIL